MLSLKASIIQNQTCPRQTGRQKVWAIYVQPPLTGKWRLHLLDRPVHPESATSKLRQKLKLNAREQVSYTEHQLAGSRLTFSNPFLASNSNDGVRTERKWWLLFFFFFWPRNTHRLSFLDCFTWFVGHRAQLLDQDLLQHLSKPIHTQHRSPEEWRSAWGCRHPGAPTAPVLWGMREKGFLRPCLPVVHIYSQSTSNTYSLSELDLCQHSSGTANRTKPENWTE